MPNNYRVKYRRGDFEIEIESSDKGYVDQKLEELLIDDSVNRTQQTKANAGSKAKKTKPKSQGKSVTTSEDAQEDTIDVVSIVNAINDADDHETIDEKILNKSNQLNRILMVAYFVHETLGNSTSFTTGDIEKVTNELGIRIKRPNAANKIKDNLKYFAADSVRKTGSVTKYRINRKGIDAYKEILKA